MMRMRVLSLLTILMLGACDENLLRGPEVRNDADVTVTIVMITAADGAVELFSLRPGDHSTIRVSVRDGHRCTTSPFEARTDTGDIVERTESACLDEVWVIDGNDG